MGGFFGVVADSDCVCDVFYGTDYHSHLGTRRGGLAVYGDDGRIMRRIHDRGFRIPEDFSIIAHDNIAYSQSTVPALTTISFGSPDEIAESLVSLLMARMQNPDGPRKKALLKSELIIRESVLRKR